MDLRYHPDLLGQLLFKLVLETTVASSEILRVGVLKRNFCVDVKFKEIGI